MAEFTTTEAREGFSDLVGRVAFAKERIIITRNGKRQAALVSVEDLEQLEALEEERGITALRRLQAGAVKRKLNQLSPKEIDAEIKAARAGRPPQP